VTLPVASFVLRWVNIGVNNALLRCPIPQCNGPLKSVSKSAKRRGDVVVRKKQCAWCGWSIWSEESVTSHRPGIEQTLKLLEKTS